MAIGRRGMQAGEARRGTDPLVEFYVQLGHLAQKAGEPEQAEHALRKALMFTVLYAGSGNDRLALHRPTVEDAVVPGPKLHATRVTRPTFS